MSEIPTERVRKKSSVTIKGKPWTTPKELGEEAELERQIEEARKKERLLKDEAQKLSEELAMEREEAIRVLTKKVDKYLREEMSGITAYEELRNISKILGDDLARYISGDLDIIINDEKKHVDRLLAILNTMKERKFGIRPKLIPPIWKKYGVDGERRTPSEWKKER